MMAKTHPVSSKYYLFIRFRLRSQQVASLSPVYVAQHNNALIELCLGILLHLIWLSNSDTQFPVDQYWEWLWNSATNTKWMECTVQLSLISLSFLGVIITELCEVHLVRFHTWIDNRWQNMSCNVVVDLFFALMNFQYNNIHI